MAAIEAPTRRDPGLVLRPGVTVPDWSLAAAPAARRALDRIIENSGRARSWSNLTVEEDRVWQAVFAEFLASDARPTAAAIAARQGTSETAAVTLLARLKSRDLVVLSSSGDEVRAAYPFSAEDVGYRVRLASRQVFALCAIDALGLGAMCEAGSTIAATCRQCGAPIEAMTGRHGAALESFSPGDALVWCGLTEAHGCAATSGCTVKTFFCRPAHLDAWRQDGRGAGDGIALSMAEAHMVGCAIFAPMRRPARDA